MPLFDSNNISRILEGNNMGLWIVEMGNDEPPRFYADKVMDELLGVEKEMTPEERFQFHRSGIHPDDKEIFEEYSNKLAAKRTEVVYRYIHPVRGEMYVRCSGRRDTTVIDKNVFMGAHQDISDIIRYEKQKTAEMRLAEAVSEKEAALQKAKKASAAKTNFLSRMSHDIRTPLNGLIGLIEISEAHKDDEELISANRKKARVAAEHLLSLINDVLDMSKLEDESVELVRVPMDIDEICKEALTICNIKAKENGIILNHDNGAAFIYKNVFGSPVHMRQLLLNILNNCVKYNRPNGEIKTSAKLISHDEKYVRYGFYIKDTGIGMSPEFLEHIFEPFTQERDDARSRYQGTGLGMSIVKNIVDKMNGTIEVKSVQGEGTEFYFEIPFEINYDSTETGVEQDLSELSIEDMCILLVEDNELNMEIAKCILEDKGARVVTATDGKKGYETFERNEPGTFDVILMDVMMPIMDGYVATDKIRKSNKPDAQTVPIIAMTANAFAEDVDKAKNAGMNEHLSKPLQIELLLKTLIKYR